MHGRRRLLSLLVAGFAAAGCNSRSEEAARDDGEAVRLSSSRAMPRPTEHWADEDAEERFHEERRAWIERMHRAEPGVDWREIERENGRREQERRNELGRGQRRTLGAIAWSEVGSSNLAGRMHCGVIGPDVQTLYAGSALGGLWRGTVGGTGWQPLGDNLYGGVHEVLAFPGDTPEAPDVLLVATDGGSVHVTRDDGLTWETPAGLSLASLRGIALLQDPSGTILLLGRGPGSGNPPTLLASTDKGRTFSIRWQAAGGWDGSLWAPRTGAAAAATVYLVDQGRLLRSTNGGFAFTTLGTIDAASDRAVLAGSEAGSPTLYATVRSGGAWNLHRSTDGGQSFSLVSSSIPDYWEALGASIHSPAVVMYGGVEVHRSTDGGATFNVINRWGDYYGDPAHKLHADLMGIYCWLDPADALDERWYFCTDGGIYESRDLGATVLNLSLQGLGVSQYYSTLTSRSNPSLILAGSQDQGYQRGIWQPSSGTGPSTPFNQLISGDYGHLTSSDGTHGLVYSTYPGFILVQEGETNPRLLFPFLDFPAGSSHDWLPAVVADPLDASTFYFCGDRLTRYSRVSGATWTQTLHSTYDFTQGGADYLTALGFAPSDPQKVYAVNDAGWRFYSTDHGVTWATALGGAPPQHYFYGNAIAVHPTDPLDVAIGGSGYSSAGVIRSTDGGHTWQQEIRQLPRTLVYNLVYAEDGTGDLYAATEAGAYRWNRATDNWENIMSNQAPLTTYWSVESANGGGTIRFGTYGRGIWDYAIPPTPERICRYGSVGGGPTPEPVLEVNGSSGDPFGREVSVAIGYPIVVTLAASTAGPSPADYALWLWQNAPVSAQPLVIAGTAVGCVVNPTPFHAGQAPQAYRCVRGGLGAEFCGTVRELRTSRTSAPWSLTRTLGFGRAITFTLQGVLEDLAADNPSELSVTNAVILNVR